MERLSTREQRLSDDNDELYHKLELLQQRLGAKNTEIGAKSAEIDSVRAQDAQKKLDVEHRLALALAAAEQQLMQARTEVTHRDLRVAAFEEQVSSLSARERDMVVHKVLFLEFLNVIAGWYMFYMQ